MKDLLFEFSGRILKIEPGRYGGAGNLTVREISRELFATAMGRSYLWCNFAVRLG
jgi:hypothetical protein